MMRSVKSVFGAAALLAALGLTTGLLARAEEKKKEEEAPAKLSAGDQAVADITTAYNLLEYGRRANQPMAVLAAAQMLLRITGPDANPDKVEGAGDAIPLTDKDVVSKLIAEAQKMEGGNTEAVKKLVAELKDELTVISRGTAGGGTTWKNIVSKNSTVKISRKFIGGKVGRIAKTELINAGVPVTIQVFIGTTQIPHVPGNANHFLFNAPKVDTVYTIVLTNKHTVGVEVCVTTN